MPATPSIPLAPIEKSDADYVDELTSIVPAALLHELGTAYVAELVRLLRKRDEELRRALDAFHSSDRQLGNMLAELMNMRALVKSLSLCITKGEELVADFDQTLLSQVLKCGEDLLVEEYAAQLLHHEDVVADGLDDLVGRDVAASLSAFQAKAGIIAQQEANRQGLTYRGCKVSPNPEGPGCIVLINYEADTGRQLDRVRLKALLERHKPVGTEVQILANVQVKVPL